MKGQMAKINIRNIVLVMAITAFDVSAGFYDRFVNGIGVIKWSCEQVSLISESSIWSTAAQQPNQIDMIASVGSINPITVIMFISFIIVVFFIVGLTCRGAGVQ